MQSNLDCTFFMDQIITYKSVEITIRRDDLLHPFVSGNKFRKLKYNLEHIKKNGFEGIVTFGGAFSNHIAATAAAAFLKGIKSVGIIRGEELNKSSNPTLQFASDNGMEFLFISRENYTLRNQTEFISTIQKQFPNYFIVPEGGSNKFAILGCEEILTASDNNFDYITCACGTGATIAGIINKTPDNTTVLGFAALNDFSIEDSIKNWSTNNKTWQLIYDYNLGGYAKTNDGLILFINDFFNKFEIPLDPVYTGKMFYGIFDMIDTRRIAQGSRVLAIHTGGLQGIKGMNEILKKKNKHIININY